MKLIGVARLGKDAELRYTQSGKAIVNLSLAMEYGKFDDRKTEWVNARLWGILAEKLHTYLTKGSQIFTIINDCHIEKYTAKNGSEGYSLVGDISEIKLIGSKKQSKQNEKSESSNEQEEFADDDIPF